MLTVQRREKIALQKICSEIDLALEFIGDKKLEEFLADQLTQLAVGMTAIKIGAFTQHLSEDFRKNHPQVDLEGAEKFGDFIAHNYETLDMEKFFDKVTNDFPKLKLQIEKILESE